MTNDLLKTFKHNILQLIGNQLIDNKFILGVSGGRDSIIMLKLCHLLDLSVIVCHCNFNLRGAESQNDEKFVVDLASKYGYLVEVSSFNTKLMSKDLKKGIQETARDIRYTFFEQIRSKHSANYIFTAHHEMDNVETFFINLNRGSGPKGLSGIPEIQGKIVRPMLNFSNADLLIFAAKYHLKWREDQSNIELDYERNYWRLEVLPSILSRAPHFSKQIQKINSIQLQYENFVQNQVEKWLNKNLTIKKNAQILNLPFDDLLPFVVRFFAMNLNFSQTSINQILECIKNKYIGKIILDKSKSNKIVLGRQIITYLPLKLENYEYKIQLKNQIFSFEFGELNIEETHQIDNNRELNCIFLPKNNQTQFIILRNRRTRDIIKIGMNYQISKKIKELYIDLKLEIFEKHYQPIIIYENEIIWIPNITTNQKVVLNTHSFWKITLI